jgi:hypothetical protein
MKQELMPTLDWEIVNKNVFSGEEVGDVKIPGYKAIRRSDNDNILSVMKNSYSPMTNSEFSEIVERIREISGFELSGFNEFKGGNKVLAFLENNKEDLYIGSHRMKNYMLLGNSFDGSSSFFQGTSSILIRCQNQFSQIQTMNKIRHTKNINTKLEEFYIYLDSFFNQREKLKETFERMGNITLTEELREKMIAFVLDVKEVSEKELSTRKKNQIEMLRNNMLEEVIDLGENVWGAFNGVTRYTTHDIETKNEVFGNVFGRQADLNNKAFEFATRELVLV